MMKVFDAFSETLRESHDVLAVNKLLKLKIESGTNPWPVIEQIIHIWSSKNPQRWEAYLFKLKEIKETRKDRKYGSTKDKITGGYIRYLLDIPQPVMKMIRALYDPNELPMNTEFFHEFAKRFPNMRVAEKV